jgi:hypothetical protein
METCGLSPRFPLRRGWCDHHLHQSGGTLTLKDALEIAASVIVSLGGGGAIVFALSGYLGKIWADRALEKQRQQNTQLNLEFTHQLGLVTELRKSEYQMRAAEHQVRFARLHETRATAIAEMYECLVDAEQDGRRFVTGEGTFTGTPEQKEARQKIQTTMQDLHLFIEKRRIYLPAHMCAALQTHLDKMSSHIYKVGSYGSVRPATPELELTQHDVFVAAYRAFFQEVPAARKVLEDEFRKILDVEKWPAPDGIN